MFNNKNPCPAQKIDNGTTTYAHNNNPRITTYFYVIERNTINLSRNNIVTSSKDRVNNRIGSSSNKAILCYCDMDNVCFMFQFLFSQVFL